MPLSWNEVKIRALDFSKEWENKVSDKASTSTRNTPNPCSPQRRKEKELKQMSKTKLLII